MNRDKLTSSPSPATIADLCFWLPQAS